MTLKELDELLRENPSFIFSLQTKVEEQEKEIQKLKDLLGIQTSSADLNIKAVNKIKEQAKEIEQLKADAERYRYLKKYHYQLRNPYSDYDFGMQLNFEVSGVWSNNQDPAVLDKMIDLARGKND